MAIQKIIPGSRMGMEDPLCQLKSEKDLLNHDYNCKEPRNTVAGKWYEDRTKQELYNNCKEKDPYRLQQDDGSADLWPIRDDSPPKPRQGGPMWTDRNHEPKGRG